MNQHQGTDLRSIIHTENHGRASVPCHEIQLGSRGFEFVNTTFHDGFVFEVCINRCKEFRGRIFGMDFVFIVGQCTTLL